MKTVKILLLALLLLILTGCTPAKDEAQTPDGQETEDTPTYEEAYCDVLTYLIGEYGQVHEVIDENLNDYCYDYAGLEYAELIDFEGDGVPELVCGCLHKEGKKDDMEDKLFIFQYQDGTAKEIFSTPYENEFPYFENPFLYTGMKDEKPYLMIMNLKAGGGYDALDLQRVSILTIENGKLQTKTALGLIKPMWGYGFDQVSYIYPACKLEDKYVSVKDYLSFLDAYTQEARGLGIVYYSEGSISLRSKIWSALHPEPQDLQDFISSLAEKANRSSQDITAYAETGNPQGTKIPYEGKPYALADMEEERQKIEAPALTGQEKEDYDKALRELFSELVVRRKASSEASDTALAHLSLAFDRIDLDNDGVFEVITDSNDGDTASSASVFCYKDGKFQEVLDIDSDSMGCDISTWNHEYFVLLDYKYSDNSGVKTDDASYYSIQSGNAVCTELVERDFGDGKIDYTIDGKAVSAEEYENRQNNYVGGSGFVYCSALYDDEIKSLAEDLGFSSAEIEALFGQG